MCGRSWVSLHLPLPCLLPAFFPPPLAYLWSYCARSSSFLFHSSLVLPSSSSLLLSLSLTLSFSPALLLVLSLFCVYSLAFLVSYVPLVSPVFPSCVCPCLLDLARVCDPAWAWLACACSFLRAPTLFVSLTSVYSCLSDCSLVPVVGSPLPHHSTSSNRSPPSGMAYSSA